FDHVGKHQSGKMQEDAFASTGYVLARELHPPAVQAAERYPKIFINPEKKTMGRKYPFSEHDNRATLKHNIDTYCGLSTWSCKNVIELGAGTGVVGLMAASLGGEDVTDFLPHPHYVLMADCIYYEQSVKPLVDTLKVLAGPETCIICCYEQRTLGLNPAVEKRFFEMLLQEFACEEIPAERQDPEFNSPDIHIL
ncbi:hypothetical protein P4O66_011762, partial [Electrophorus voltai]